MHGCVRAYACSHIYLYVGVSYLTYQLIGVLLFKCYSQYITFFFFFQALFSVLDLQYVFSGADVFLTLSAWLKSCFAGML